MSLIPEAVEIHTDTHGCYYAVSYYNEKCSVFTLVSNRTDFEKDITDFVMEYATWQESDISVLLVDFDYSLNCYLITPLGVQIDPIQHDYPHSAPEEKKVFRKGRIINFFEFFSKTIEQDALISEKNNRKMK